MHFHYGLDIDYEAIINDFARKHPRRMELTNLIDEDRMALLIVFVVMKSYCSSLNLILATISSSNFSLILNWGGSNI